MSFREQPFKQRMAKMGDEAEGVFEKVEPFGPLWDRNGWNRPRSGMKGMSLELRTKPDYYVNGLLVEVMGLGRDGILKLKLDKWEGLKFWNKVQPTDLFVWNSHTQQWLTVRWMPLKKLVSLARSRGVEAFWDGPEYYPILWEELKAFAERVEGHLLAEK